MSVKAYVACSSGVNFARSCFELNALLSRGGEGKEGKGKGGKGREGEGGEGGGKGSGEGRGREGEWGGEGEGRGTMQHFLIENHPGKQ